MQSAAMGCTGGHWPGCGRPPQRRTWQQPANDAANPQAHPNPHPIPCAPTADDALRHIPGLDDSLACGALDNAPHYEGLLRKFGGAACRTGHARPLAARQHDLAQRAPCTAQPARLAASAPLHSLPWRNGRNPLPPEDSSSLPTGTTDNLFLQVYQEDRSSHQRNGTAQATRGLVGNTIPLSAG